MTLERTNVVEVLVVKTSRVVHPDGLNIWPGSWVSLGVFFETESPACHIRLNVVLLASLQRCLKLESKSSGLIHGLELVVGVV